MSTALAPSADRERLAGSRLEQLTRMIEIRALEDRIVGLFAAGLVHGTTHTCQGQEAVAVGTAAALRTTDGVACTYRGHGTALALGLTCQQVLGEIMGRPSGAIGGVGGSMHIGSRAAGMLPTCAIVGAGIPIAAGIALSAQVRGTDDVAVAIFGDGATNIGAFHEGLNLAAVWNLPVVFVCENNLYGEYSRLDRTTPIHDLARRAYSYAMAAEVVDGMDLDVVRTAVEGAVGRARSGGGPTLLEMKTYRYAGHSRADQATYRPEGELASWQKRDPVAMMSTRLVAEGLTSRDDLDQLTVRLAAEVDVLIARVSAEPEAGLDRMFRHIWGARAAS